MKITTIQISGFRKILKATINMEDDITVIAGANNSGKTSIVELFNYVFNAKGALCSDDFPVYESQEWCTAVFPYFQAQFKQENKKDDLIANILGTIVPSENPENEMLLTPIEVLIQVDYDPAGDDIRNFADYIMELDPRIIISHSIQAEIENLRKTDPDTLILYLFNKERFSDIDAINLYNAFDKMEKYSFGKAVSAVDVLTTHYEDNPDSLLKVLFCIVELLRLYKAQQYGSIIQILKGNKSVFSKDSWNIKTHNDKETVFNSIKQVFNIIESESKTIADLIRGLSNVHLLNEAYLSGIVDDDDYKLAELVPVVEVVHVADYLCNPRVSTQHGVKGESHDSVVFVAEDSSNNPCVAMYRFFEMWGQIQISAKTLNQFYYNFAAEVDNIQQSIGIKGSVLKKGTYIANEEMIKAKLHTVFDRFKDDPYFQFIYGADYESYFSKPGVTKARDCLKGNTAYSILSAYKLFYVGCSRARRNLTILLDSSKIKGNLEPQKKRFEEIGFQVVSSPIH